MTNEQLAEFIQGGEADDLKPVLYNRVKHLMYKICGQYFGRYAERFSVCGVELSDLRQECYDAFLKAVRDFKPGENTCFINYLNYHIKNFARAMLGINNSEQTNKKPLDNCTSLDKELETSEGSVTLESIIPDEASQQAFR